MGGSYMMKPGWVKRLIEMAFFPHLLVCGSIWIISAVHPFSTFQWYAFYVFSAPLVLFVFYHSIRAVIAWVEYMIDYIKEGDV